MHGDRPKRSDAMESPLLLQRDRGFASSLESSPASTRSTPSACIALFFSRLLPMGTTIVAAIRAGVPRNPLPGRNSPGRRDYACDFGMIPPQRVDIHQPAADLERAHRRVVLVLHPDFASGACGQQWPWMLRSRRHRLVHDFCRQVQVSRDVGNFIFWFLLSFICATLHFTAAARCSR